MMSLTFGLFIQVSDSGSHDPDFNCVYSFAQASKFSLNVAKQPRGTIFCLKESQVHILQSKEFPTDASFELVL